MSTNTRKEIIQVNGITMLVILTLVADFLIVGFVYRWHNWELFANNKKHQIAYTQLLKESHDLKEEIVRLEGVGTWRETSFFSIHPDE